MNKNFLLGVALAFVGGAAAALALVAGDGLTAAELLSGVSAGIAAAVAYTRKPAS